MNIILLNDRVLIRVPEETKTASGLLVSKENDASSFKKGTVVAAGKGFVNNQGQIIPMSVKEGDEVVFSYGEIFVAEGEKFFLVKESDISMITNDDKGAKNNEK